MRFRSILASAALASLVSTSVAHADDTSRRACSSAYEKAQTLRRGGKLRASRVELLACSQATCPAVISSDCVQWLKEVDSSLSSVVFSVRDHAGADVVEADITQDGEPLTSKLDGTAVAVDPGSHLFRVQPKSGEPIETRIIIREGEKLRIIPITLPAAVAAAPKDAPPPKVDAAKSDRPSLVPVAILGGTAVVALGVSLVVGLGAKSDADNLKSTCAPHCASTDVDAVRSKVIISDIAFGVGIVAAGVATYLLVTRPASKERSAATSLHVGPAPGGAVFGLRSSF